MRNFRVPSEWDFTWVALWLSLGIALLLCEVQLVTYGNPLVS